MTAILARWYDPARFPVKLRAPPRPCCPHPVERHAYNGCADCIKCSVTWGEHPLRALDTEAHAEDLEKNWHEHRR